MIWLAIAAIAALWILLSGVAQSADAATGDSVVPSQVLQWSELAQQYAQANAVLDPEEILAVIWIESAGNPDGQNPGDPSWGLMGVTALIAHAYGGFDAADLSWHSDPEKNIKAGAAFLADLKTKYADNYQGWVAAYNEGETNLLRGYKDQAYVNKFTANLAALKGSI
jgi:soluble lytic murein transglycosylase-like protein